MILLVTSAIDVVSKISESTLGWVPVVIFFFAIVLVLLIKDKVECLLRGIDLFLGKDYNETNVLIYEEKPHLLTKIGWFDIYLLELEEKYERYIIVGNIVVIPNASFRKLKLRKALPNLKIVRRIDVKEIK